MTTTTLLDGGMGREIKQRITQWDPVLWSTSGLIYDPQLVCDIHCEFIEAGADVIKTSNYMVTPYALEKANRLADFESLTALSAAIAQQAKTQSGRSTVRVAGSLPPLGTTYRSDLVDTDRLAAVKTYATMMDCLDVDVLIAESLSSMAEAESIIAAYAGRELPLYISFLLDDDHPGQLLDGTPVQAMIDAMDPDTVSAVLFNCCHPDTISATLRMIQNPAISLGAYANAFVPLVESFNHGDARTSDASVTPTAYLQHVRTWLAHGVTLVGGCCGIGPGHIRAIATELKA
jgi:S-methylmethionine-dependent homocysteine/selenocysteine methylase